MAERDEQIKNMNYQNQQDLKEATDKTKLMEIEKQELRNSLNSLQQEKDKETQ